MQHVVVMFEELGEDERRLHAIFGPFRSQGGADRWLTDYRAKSDAENAPARSEFSYRIESMAYPMEALGA